MVRLQLYLDQPDPGQAFRFLRPDGTADQLPALRLKVYVDLKSAVRPGSSAGVAAFPLCVLDTGSHLTTIPERISQHFLPGFVTPLPFDPAMPQKLRVVSLAGGTYPYQLGELTIRLRDLAGNQMDVTVVAQLTRDNGTLPIPLVLGLRGGVIDGRVLRCQPDPNAPFSQAWWLEAP